MSEERTNRIVSILTSLLLIVGLVFSSFSPSFADNVGTKGNRSGTKKSSGSVKSSDKGHRGLVFAWYDRGGWLDQSQAGSDKSPAQGWYNGKTGKWVKAKEGEYAGKYTYDIFIDKLTKKVRKRGGSYKYSKILKGTVWTQQDKALKAAMEEACKRAIKREKKINPDTYRARVVGVAVTYATWGGIAYRRKSWSNVWNIHFSKKDKSFENMFGKRQPKTNNKLNGTALDAELPNKYGWGALVDKDKFNNANAEDTWAKYLWKQSKADFSKFSSAVGEDRCQIYVIAVTDNWLSPSPEFSTKIVNESDESKKLNVSTPGNVTVQDEILYKNVDEAKYKVSADLIVSDDVNLEGGNSDDDTDDPSSDADMEGDPSEDDNLDFDDLLQSEDKVVTLDAEGNVTIDNNNSNYSSYTNGRFVAVAVRKDSNNEWNDIVLTKDLVAGQNIIEVPAVDAGDEEDGDVKDEYWLAIYYKGTGQNVDIDSDTPLVSDVFSNFDNVNEENLDDDFPEEEYPYEDTDKEGTIIASVSKATPSPNFKTGENQEDWQRGSFITLQGKNDGYLDLFKSELFVGIPDFDKTYKAAIRAKVYDKDDKAIYRHNYDFKDSNEATEITNPFGAITFDKTIKNNHNTDSQIETGSTFQVYMTSDKDGNSTGYNSYADALNDERSKGYSTYRYNLVTVSNNKINHGKYNGKDIIDNLRWKYNNGMLVPGTYTIKQVTSGDFYKDSVMIEPFTVKVEASKVTDAGKKENDHPKFKLILQKISADKFETGDPNHSTDGRYQHSRLQNVNTAFNIKSLDSSENASSTGYDKTFNTVEELNSQITIDNLPSGKYRITEVGIPTGYYMSPADAFVDIYINNDMKNSHQAITIDQIHQSESGFTNIIVSDKNSLDDSGNVTSGDEKTTSQSVVKSITWVKSNIPQDTSLNIVKMKTFKNELGLDEEESMPNVEFNLYAKGDIIAYDGHGDHVYYRDGQLIQGIIIDEETGERHYYADGEEITSDDSYAPIYNASKKYYEWVKVGNKQKYRILTDNEGKWNSLTKSSNSANTYIDYVGSDSSSFPYYPLTNNNLIKIDGSDKTDGVSEYELKEMYVWEPGGHISFTNEQKDFLRNIWVNSLQQKADEEIVSIGMTFNQILNHGIDITYQKTTDEQGNQDDTARFSSNGRYLDGDSTFKQFLQNRLIGTSGKNWLDLKNRQNTNIVDNNNRVRGTVDWNAWVIDPEWQKDIENKKTEIFTKHSGDLTSTEEHANIEINVQNDEYPKITTNASLNTNQKSYDPLDEKITIKDVVSYSNLDVDKTYTLVGTLMNPVTGEPFLHEGKPITSTKDFVPGNKVGKTEVVFKDILTKDLLGENVVIFEKLYLNDEFITSHEDINDKKQLIPVIPRPKLRTVANVEGYSSALSSRDVKLVDTITMENLPEDDFDYKLEGTLMDKKSNSPLVDSEGNAIKSEKEFKGPKTEETMEFTIDTSNLKNKDIVVFEVLYQKNVDTGEWEVVSRHEDINDKSQTIHIPEASTHASWDKNKEGVKELVLSDEEEVEMTDTIRYKNLIPGNKYSATGYLYDADTLTALTEEGNNKPSVRENDKVETIKNEDGSITVKTLYATKSFSTIDGENVDLSKLEDLDKAISATTEFVPDKKNGEVQVMFKFKKNALYGTKIVTFENVDEIPENGPNYRVAVHAQWDDESQITYIPEIGTKASVNGKQIDVETSDNISLTDTVTYKNLAPNRTHLMKGVLMDKSTGEPIKDSEGKEITAEKEFTPEEPDGTVEIVFTFNGKYLYGKSVVAFEKCYDISTYVKPDPDKPDTPPYPDGKEVVISKTSVGGGDELPGAHMVLTNDEDEVVDVWVSETTPHTVKLDSGDYYLEETVAPEGYTVITKFGFNVDSEGKVTTTSTQAKCDDAHITVMDHAITEPDTPRLVATHEDINDPEQTVKFEELNPDYEMYKVRTSKAKVKKIKMKNSNTYGFIQGSEVYYDVHVKNTGNIELTMDVVDKYVEGKDYFTEPEVTDVSFTKDGKWNNKGNSKTVANITIQKGEEAVVTFMSKVKPEAEEYLAKAAKDSDSLDENGKDTNMSNQKNSPDMKDGYKNEASCVNVTYPDPEDPYNPNSRKSIDPKKDIAQTPVQRPEMELRVTIAKADKDKIHYYLKGAEITIFDKNGNIAKDKNGKKCVGTTDKNGKVKFVVLYGDNDEYYAQETKAPKGYRINNEKFEVKPEGYNIKGSDIKISILDEAIIIPPTPNTKPAIPVKTGDSTAIFIFVASILAALSGLLITRKFKK